jgi:hypothetical protein
MGAVSMDKSQVKGPQGNSGEENEALKRRASGKRHVTVVVEMFESFVT